jgi:glutamate synthase (NADPH/NADH) large chain
MPQDAALRAHIEDIIAESAQSEGLPLLGFRDVPVDNSSLSKAPDIVASEPFHRQVFIGRTSDIPDDEEYEARLYLLRKVISGRIYAENDNKDIGAYCVSLSARTIVYKGMFLAYQVGAYYKDLKDSRFETALILVHQRFSTNTFPSWKLAHPYRMVAHNGEINTVRGNNNWMAARQASVDSELFGNNISKLWPISYDGQSDTACFDNALELLLMAGYPIAQAMMMMIPEAWENHTTMDDNRRAFYEYHAAMMEPWDGPAAMAFTDGRHIGGTLDRNGLRPARYIVTDDDLVVMASESGVLPIPESKIIQKWRLQPGKMFLIDLEAGRIIDDQELKNTYANAKPYKAWINSVRIKLDEIKLAEGQAKLDRAQGEKAQPSLLDRQQAFGYTQEDLKFLMAPMALAGEEATGSMGNDSPLAVMSNKLKPLYNYFKQLFAQVTNPPIDPIREAMVMSLVSFIGPKPNLLDTNNVNPPMRLEVAQPVLGFDDMARLRNISAHTGGKFKSYELDICYPLAWGKEGVEACLASLCAEAVDAVKSGHNILIVSDRAICADQVAIPALLATSTVHQHLVSKGLRASTGLVVETGSARETHHFALLAGYGAEAVHPYLAMETLAEMAHGLPGDLSGDKAIYNYTKAVGKGLMKVMSKMGISTYMSYCGAQIFEAIGLNKSLVDKYFKGTASNVEGIGVFEVAEEALRLHALAFGNDPVLVDKLDAGGEYAFRVRGEDHMWTPDAIAKLQHSTRSNNFSSYKEYAQIINDQSRRHLTLRGLFEFKLDPTKAIPLDEVEPAKEIVKRFATGAMSLGSISTEAHATLAVAMNRIGGKSNTGEGGEDPNRYTQELKGIPIRQGDTMASVVGAEQIVVDIPLQEGDSMRSRIKQVASGRFGVTAAYLNSADQIQIKMAQGAKPGEGGQLPGHKVSEYIASLRFSVPGVGLISPPPHHDIYSIEDLAQLIHDLKNANPRASISVKLVSEVGIGTVAAGVTKAKADHVVVAGHDGGTGASPLSSVKHAGTPWELGLAETQQTLVLNGLRSRIRVQADGQMKTGRDVVIAALLGADEIGFATAPLVVEGCIMMRKCHLNTCPVGVATQDPVLRAKFSGKPEYVVNYFFFVAEEARQLMAQLGIRTYDELIGRVDLLDKSKAISHWKAQGLDFSSIFYKPETPDGQACRHVEFQDHALEKALDHKLIAQARAALEKGERVSFISPVRNLNRTVGTMLSGEVAKKYGHAGLPDDTIHIQLQGTAGQSACAFLAHGITIDLVGEGNDYVGKGLSGGRIIVRPNTEFRGWAVDNIIIGNTVLYGAIAGEAFFNGVAGERFAVRNSGATTVVEGLGDHGCEYMTGGTVVVLGNTGRNFAAGMSGGIAYVYDPAGDFATKCNTAMVSLDKVVSAGEQHVDRDAWHTQHRDGVPEADEVILKRLIERHFKHTGSTRARVLLDDWAAARGKFVKVFPNEYKRALIEMAADAAMEVQAVAA